MILLAILQLHVVQLNAAILENDVFSATSIEEYLIVKQNFIGQRTAH